MYRIGRFNSPCQVLFKTKLAYRAVCSRVVASQRRLAAIEPAAVFALILAYIWALYGINTAWCVPILGVIVFSHVLRHENARALGFQTSNLRKSCLWLAPLLAILALAALAAGLTFGTIRPIGMDDALGGMALYLPWGLLQQYILNGYFYNRMEALTTPSRSSLITAALFAAVHSPNWFLMGVTLVAGYGATIIYRKYRNLYVLGIAHAVVGLLLFLVVPDSISHHLRVGPGWFGR